MAIQVKLKKNGQIISVYKHRDRGTWVNAHDCNTEYQKDEVEPVKMNYGK